MTLQNVFIIGIVVIIILLVVHLVKVSNEKQPPPVLPINYLANYTNITKQRGVNCTQIDGPVEAIVDSKETCARRTSESPSGSIGFTFDINNYQCTPLLSCPVTYDSNNNSLRTKLPFMQTYIENKSTTACPIDGGLKCEVSDMVANLATLRDTSTCDPTCADITARTSGNEWSALKNESKVYITDYISRSDIPISGYNKTFATCMVSGSGSGATRSVRFNPDQIPSDSNCMSTDITDSVKSTYVQYDRLKTNGLYVDSWSTPVPETKTFVSSLHVVNDANHDQYVNINNQSTAADCVADANKLKSSRRMWYDSESKKCIITTLDLESSNDQTRTNWIQLNYVKSPGDNIGVQQPQPADDHVNKTMAILTQDQITLYNKFKNVTIDDIKDRPALVSFINNPETYNMNIIEVNQLLFWSVYGVSKTPAGRDEILQQYYDWYVNKNTTTLPTSVKSVTYLMQQIWMDNTTYKSKGTGSIMLLVSLIS